MQLAIALMYTAIDDFVPRALPFKFGGALQLKPWEQGCAIDYYLRNRRNVWE